MTRKYRFIFFTMIVFFLVQCNFCFANFLKDQPNKYFEIGKDQVKTVYVDLDSIQATRYDPPFYQIYSEIFIVDYVKSHISKMGIKHFYNYDKQTIAVQLTNASFYMDDGQLIKTAQFHEDLEDLRDVSNKNSYMFFEANIAFYKCYNKYFTKDF